MEVDEQFIKEIVRLVYLILDKVKDRISKQLRKSIIESIECNEWGIAFDCIIADLYEEDQFISVEEYNLIEIAAKMMKLEENEYLYIKERIKG